MENVRIGIFGCGPRGLWLGKEFKRIRGCSVVALCDEREGQEPLAHEAFGADCPFFTSFDEFIETGLDAVLLCNLFYDHARYAVKCLERGIHVLSECISNGTMAEGVQLVKAAKRSSAFYMLLENYPQMVVNREMQGVVKGGTLGKILYAEGEYNHPFNPADTTFIKEYQYHAHHWRNYLPRTYYITHSLAPLMRATGSTPRFVSAVPCFAPADRDVTSASHVGDRAAIITTKNDDGTVYRITGCAAFGAHHNSYRICGTNGQIENLRGMGEKIMLRYNEWQIPEGREEINLYDAPINDPDAELIRQSAHGGGDYVTIRMFVECVRDKRQPEHPFDVDSAVAMSSCAILGLRSMLDGGKYYEIPDFNDEKWCKMYEDDYITPFYGVNDEPPTIPCCSVPDYEPTKEQMNRYFESLK